MKSIQTLLAVLVASATLTACSSDCGCPSRCSSPCAPPPCSPCGGGYGMRAPAGPAYAGAPQGAPQVAPQYAPQENPQSGYGQPGAAPAGPSAGGAPPAGQPGAGTIPQGGGQEANVVTVQNRAYSPPTLTVRLGTTVRWVNRDPDVHTATGNGFDVQIPPGGEGSHTFFTAGTYDVTCRFHPVMKGQVVVQ